MRVYAWPRSSASPPGTPPHSNLQAGLERVPSCIASSTSSVIRGQRLKLDLTGTEAESHGRRWGTATGVGATERHLLRKGPSRPQGGRRHGTASGFNSEAPAGCHPPSRRRRRGDAVRPGEVARDSRRSRASRPSAFPSGSREGQLRERRGAAHVGERVTAGDELTSSSAPDLLRCRPSCCPVPMIRHFVSRARFFLIVGLLVAVRYSATLVRR